MQYSNATLKPLQSRWTACLQIQQFKVCLLSFCLIGPMFAVAAQPPARSKSLDFKDQPTVEDNNSWNYLSFRKSPSQSPFYTVIRYFGSRWKA